MSYSLIKKINKKARLGEIKTPYGKIKTPFFMPVGTQGSVKSVSSEELNLLGAQIVLSNTYHLYLRPGEKLIKKLGGIHKFMNWEKPILTDSGGYQVFSLGKPGAESLVKIVEDGVIFKSYLDGSEHLFTPEKVIDIQLDLGVDILMPLDVCPSGKASKDEVKNACEITIEWAKRSKKHFEKKTDKLKKRPLLHGIVQGGLYSDLRRWCAEELVKFDFDGYSVGGLAVDNETRNMWGIVKLMGEILPEDKQRYLMGVGTPDDIVKAVNLGMDMFDCVLPTRMARHGSVYVRKDRNKPLNPDIRNFELINLLNSKYREDKAVIDKNCVCLACQKGRGYSKAYISHLLRSNEILGLRLATLHNVYQYLSLMDELRGN